MIFLIILSVIFQIVLYCISKKIMYYYNKRYLILGCILSITSAILVNNKYSFNIKSIILLCIIIIAISCALIDIVYQEIPDLYSLSILILGLCLLFLNRCEMYPNVLFGYQLKNYEMELLTCTILFVLFYVFAIFTGALGGGDVKLIGALGLIIPLNQVMNLLVVISFIGAIEALILMIFKKRKKEDYFAFAPSIILGVIVILLSI